MENDPDDDHVPGLGGVDYPILQAIPKTSFKCTKEMRLSGRMFADPETACQVRGGESGVFGGGPLDGQ